MKIYMQGINGLRKKIYWKNVAYTCTCLEEN